MYTMRAVRFQWARAYSTLGAGSENAYKILGLERNCSAENVRAAFRELAKATHPDKQPSLSGSVSSAQFVRVLAAYQARFYTFLYHNLSCWVHNLFKFLHFLLVWG